HSDVEGAWPKIYTDSNDVDWELDEEHVKAYYDRKWSTNYSAAYYEDSDYGTEASVNPSANCASYAFGIAHWVNEIPIIMDNDYEDREYGETNTVAATSVHAVSLTGTEVCIEVEGLIDHNKVTSLTFKDRG